MELVSNVIAARSNFEMSQIVDSTCRRWVLSLSNAKFVTKYFASSRSSDGTWNITLVERVRRIAVKFLLQKVI